MSDIDYAMMVVRDEIEKATKKFGEFNSAHEGYAVLREEVDELWDDIKADLGYTAMAAKEAIQVAAMAVRYLLDVSKRYKCDKWDYLLGKCLCEGMKCGCL